MIVYRNKFIRIRECWNVEEAERQDADLVRRFQQPQPIDGMYCREFYTILIDLQQSEETLWSLIKKGSRYEIRRAEKEDFVYERHSGTHSHILEEFCNFYDEFAARLALPPLRRDWMRLLGESGFLTFSTIAERQGAKLIWHCYHRSPQRITLLHSASSLPAQQTSAWRNKMGRGHRFHHWQDILRSREEGNTLYDFGGWYDGDTDHKRLQINKFKEEFGGEIVRNYICEQPLTWRGSLFLRVRRSLLGNAI